MRNILYILLVLALNAKAQLGKEAWHWQFGYGVSLDFSSGTPIVGTSSISTLEGCASYSDPNTGQLLFYTDGTTVWDRNNHKMPNGYDMIGGYGTSTQAALIIPKPCSSNIYYLISADQGGYYLNYTPNGTPNKGIHYSIVDMSLHGGLGDVDSSSKNILLTPPPATEKLVGVKHDNGLDYWIITHPFLSNNFNAYLVTSAGINSTPVVSSVGTIHTNISFNSRETIGYLKVSPNRQRLALGIGQDISILEVYDFNASNGQVTNPITITYPDSAAPYGISFSPDNTKLYTTYTDRYGKGNLYQYDLSSGVASSIIASQTALSLNNNHLGALQIGPDGKIYVANNGGNSLSAINNPNLLGFTCNYQDAAIILQSNSCSFGLPNFSDGGVFITNPLLTTNNLFDTTLCTGSNIILNAGGGFSKYFWSTGDTTQKVKIYDPGIYTVKCKLDSAQMDSSQCFFRYDTFKVVLHAPPLINLGKDTVFCSGSITLSVPYGNTSYLWNTGATNISINVTKTGTYWIEVNLKGCVISDTINVYADTNHIHISYPNIITPNGDNVNDYIMFGNGLFNSLHLEIYNRWGKRIFTSDDPLCIWSPNEYDIDNAVIDDGTYYYVASYSLTCGGETETKTAKGFITVVK